WRWPPSENAAPYQWQAQVRKKGHLLQTKTFETRAEAEQWARAIEVEMDKGAFVSRAEAESTTLKELLERYLDEVTPLKKGAEPETNRLRLTSNGTWSCSAMSSRSPARNGASMPTIRCATSNCPPVADDATGACNPGKKPAC
ncbi:MAG: hypothetical protein WBM81_04165, partial [Sedimenticolaceae bacterium]